MNVTDIEAQAQHELDVEEKRRRIDAAKERIRATRGRPWWRRLFPFTIKIERR